MTTTTDEELANLSDEEREALEGEEIGTLTDAERDAKAAEAIRDDAAAELASADDAADSADHAALTPRLAPPTVDGADDKIAELLDQRKAIRAQYREGDLSAEEKEAREDELEEQLTALRAAKMNAEFVANYNQQMAEADYIKSIERVRAEILEKDGIDYSKRPLLETAWDVRVRALATDPANAGKPADWYLREGHKQVMAELDQTTEDRSTRRRAADPNASQNAVNDAIRNRRVPETRAKSLGALPAAAADSGHANSAFSHLDRLNGDDLEAAVARMTPEQQEQWAQS